MTEPVTDAVGRPGRGYGLIRKRPDRRDFRFMPPTAYTGAFVDLSSGFPERPWDQGQLGSCVPHGGAACADFARVKAGLPPLNRPSRSFLYYQGRVRGGYPIRQDTGLQIRDVFEVLAKDGAPPESDWPYDISRFTEKPPAKAYDDAKHDEALKYGAVNVQDIDSTIASGYPVCFGFDVYASFESDKTASTGVMPIPNITTEQLLGGHCGVFCSTPKDGSQIKGGAAGVKYRKTRNSWGLDWGIPDEVDRGYYWFPVQYAESQAVSDFWVVTTMGDPNAPQPPTPPGPPSFPVVLGEALVSADSDPAVARFLEARHTGDIKVSARHLSSILAAPRAGTS